MESLDIIIRIRKIVRSINLESKRIQKDFGLSIPQLLCLDKLKKSTSYQATHSDIMKFLSLNSSTVTGIVNRLESRGLVARIPSRDDKRITCIALTSKGLKLLEGTPNILHDKLASYLEKLPENDKIRMVEVLDMIISSMQIEGIDASPVLTIEDPLTGGDREL